MTDNMKAQIPYRKKGFTLIEIAVAVTIIGILAVLALPAFQRSRDNTRIGALKHDLRLFEQELDTFELEHRYYPATMNTTGVFPLGMENRISKAWKLPSPIGGSYRWIYTTEEDPNGRSGYINIVNTATYPIKIDPDRLQSIDEDFDDGDPSSGLLQIDGQNLRYYIKLQAVTA